MSEDLNSGMYFGSNDKPEYVFDGNMLYGSEDSSSDCEIGMEFKEGHIGMIK
jgi:hypothetical protein